MVEYRKIEPAELTPALLAGFARHQEVKRCWRKEDGTWVLRNIAFTEEWDAADYAHLLECLRGTLAAGGSLTGAFEAGRLVGFASVEAKRFGRERQYCQLSSLHVSFESRGRGIGSKLIQCACAAGRALGAEKLYISAHSAEETQAFYRAMGCVEAEEYDPALTAAEPCDCQLELAFAGGGGHV